MASEYSKLLEEARLRAEITSSVNDYVKALQDAKNTETEILNLKKKLNTANLNQAEKDALEELIKELERYNKVLEATIKNVNRRKLLIHETGKVLGKAISNLDGKLITLYRNFDGLFKMDSATKKAALSMGLLSNETKSFTKNIREVAIDYSNQLGVGVEQLAEMSANYSDSLGRSVEFSKEGLKAMAQLSTVTALGAEGAAQMAADMDTMGYSAERTRDFVEETLNDSHKMGLNASKVIKNIQQNMKMLNKYNFKDGAKGLARMAETTTKLGVNMDFASGMAEKLFDIEGAVDMSAQLQVMGGEWAKLADPFQLMYMARNDMEGLTESVMKAAESAAVFVKETGEFEISGLEMHRLRKVAEQMGVSYDELAESAKKARKFSEIKSQVNFSLNASDDDKKLMEYITSKSELGKDGKATILISGEKKLLSSLTTTDKKILREQALEQQSLEERAKQAQTFDDKLTNLINMVKTTMLPIVDGLNKVLSPLVDKFMNNQVFIGEMKKLGEDIATFVVAGAKVVKWLGELAVSLGPTGALAAYFGVKGIFSIAKWLSSGYYLGQGFNAATSTGIGGVAKNLGKAGLGIAGAGVGIAGGMAAGGGGKGATIGSVIGTAAGALGYLIPGVGFVTGPALMALGGLAGGWLGGKLDEPKNDAIISRPLNDFEHKNKSINKSINIKKIGDGLGKDFSKNRAIFENEKSTKLIEGGRISPIDDKDEFYAKKPGGAIDKALNNGVNIVKHEFGEIKFSGNIDLTLPGNQKEKIDINQLPMNEITMMVHSETQKAFNLGKKLNNKI